jgi:hypothetical protein
VHRERIRRCAQSYANARCAARFDQKIVTRRSQCGWRKTIRAVPAGMCG